MKSLRNWSDYIVLVPDDGSIPIHRIGDGECIDGNLVWSDLEDSSESPLAQWKGLGVRTRTTFQCERGLVIQYLNRSLAFCTIIPAKQEGGDRVGGMSLWGRLVPKTSI